MFWCWLPTSKCQRDAERNNQKAKASTCELHDKSEVKIYVLIHCNILCVKVVFVWFGRVIAAPL